MLDIELLAQAAALISGEFAQDTATQLVHCATLGWCGDSDVQFLQATYARLQNIQQVARLVSADTFDPMTIGQGAQEFLLRETGSVSLGELKAEITDAQSKSVTLIGQILSR